MTQKERILRNAKISIAVTMRRNNYATLYIGATNNVRVRKRRYAGLFFKGLIKTSSYNNARYYETELINYAMEKYPTCNIKSDSVGLNPRSKMFTIYFAAGFWCPV